MPAVATFMRSWVVRSTSFSAAFTAAVVLTVVCMRLHEREKQKRKHEEDAT